jgi:hypothetical protein
LPRVGGGGGGGAAPRETDPSPTTSGVVNEILGLEREGRQSIDRLCVSVDEYSRQQQVSSLTKSQLK